jgi:hypothetical protein
MAVSDDRIDRERGRLKWSRPMKPLAAVPTLAEVIDQELITPVGNSHASTVAIRGAADIESSAGVVGP